MISNITSTNLTFSDFFEHCFQNVSNFVLEFLELQNRTKASLDNSLRDFLKHDWLEDGHTFPLMKYYTDLVWKRTVKEAMGKKEKSMKGMDELLKVPGAGTKCIKILVEGRFYLFSVQLFL